MTGLMETIIYKFDPDLRKELRRVYLQQMARPTNEEIQQMWKDAGV